MKKKFTVPTVTKVVNNEVMAAVCDEQFVYTSAGGVTSTGHARVCYHYRSFPTSSGVIGYSQTQYAKVINVPVNAEFVAVPPGGTTRDGYTVAITGTMNFPTGWYDFQGTNGNCHFVGDIYVNGVLIDRSNINQYEPSSGIPIQ